MTLVSKILAAIFFGVVVVLATSPLAATFVESSSGTTISLVAFALVAVLCIWAPTGRRAWGRGSLLAGVSFIALPLTVGALSAKAVTEVVGQAATADAGATAVGATLGAGMMVGASAFIGFILGAIFIIAGLVLVLGGRREVVIVQTSSTN